METYKFQSVMHPVRVQIMLALRKLERGTTQEIARQCPGIPPATLYRHLAALNRDGVLEVVQENRVNGIVEKVYRLAEDLPAEVEAVQADELMKLLAQFMFASLEDFEKYLSSGKGEPTKECGFRYTLMNLTEEEFMAFCQDLHQCLAKYEGLEPSPQRKLWRFSTITVPIEL